MKGIDFKNTGYIKERYQLEKFLKDNKISFSEATRIISRTKDIKTDEHFVGGIKGRYTWKMWRFTLYLWARVDNEKKGIKKNRIETVDQVVMAPKYKRLYDTFPLPKFDHNNEIKKLTQLIAEPRQDKEFKSKNFVYEGTKRSIPHEVIDKLR